MERLNRYIRAPIVVGCVSETADLYVSHRLAAPDVKFGFGVSGLRSIYYCVVEQATGFFFHVARLLSGLPIYQICHFL